MKKRIVSLLLCLCMAFSLLPVSALATTDVEVTLGRKRLGQIERTLEMNTGISGYTDTTQQLTPESVTLSVGQQGSFQRLPTATFNNVKYSPKSYGVIRGRCVDVSNPDVVGDFQYSLEYYTGTNYPCLQFNYTAKQAGTARITLEFFYNFGFDPSEVTNGNTWWRQTKTINVTVTDSATVPEKPEKPTVNDIERFRNKVNTTSSSKGAVYMWCANSLYDHGAWFSYLTDVEGGYSLGEVVANTESNAASYPWVCPMTVYGDKYLAAYNSAPGYTRHWLEDGEPATQTVNWYYSAGDGMWKYKSEKAPIYFNITHDNPYREPTTADFADQAILVKCDTDDSHSAQLRYSDGTYTINWTGDDRCTLTFDVDSYVATYAQTHEGHTAVEGQTVTKGFSYSNGEWKADDMPRPEIHVVCESTQPPTPDKPTAPSKEDLSKLEKPVEVVCTTNSAAHTAATFALIEGTYSIGDVTGDETDGYTCDITVTADEYVTKYNIDSGPHTLTGDNTKTLTLKYVDGKWVANGNVTFNVECTEAEKFPVELVIYRNGDTAKPYKRVRVAEVAKGTEIKAADYPIKNYYDGTNSGGKYDFYGWYDDGLWNIYKNDLTKQLAGLTTKTVNGWTNLKCMVYDYENVVYYMSDADRVADNRLFATTARKGAALPTADAPTATRDGYTFTFWSREGQSSDVTGQTVNGWTNLVANWKVTPHNIYAYARLNSYFAPLTTKEFDTPITLNDATLSRLGLGSYNSLGYISIGSFDFDAMPLTGDQYFGDDAELSTVAEKLATDIALENGVSKDTAEKIAWTVLYKTVNEEDMAPGYPADAGYQLSGNLNLASVTFRAGAENVENMPAVNYTYDDGAIDFYDFYFAGDTFTLPTTEPTREGYSFEGWSVKVLPDENDAVCYDADGANDAADETLLKAGDTYTITGGGVVFTAQWKLNTYIIASTLRINGNEPVKETGKTYSWSHRYGGDYGVTIDYTDMFKALKDKTLEVDAENKPYDAEIKLCFPGSSNLFNEAILTYGQDGGGWNPGVKNTAYIWGYATTSYEVIFDSDGGSAVDTKIVKYGEKAVKPEDPTMKGYNFLGWFDKDGNPFNFDTEITHKTELTAQWEKKDYIIASDLRINGDTANLADGKDYPWTHRYGGKYEETIDYQPMFDALKARALEADKANEPNPTKVDVELRFPNSSNLFNETILTYGQDGGGWNPGVKNTAYIWGYAWTYYDVTFVTPEGATTVDAQLIKNGDCAAKPADPTREGYKFLGWFDKDGNLFDFNTEITHKTELTARWEKKTYTVTFDPNSGEVAPTSKLVTFDAAYGELPTPTRENYRFVGWYLNGVRVTKDTIVKTAANHTLLAGWSRSYHALTINYVDKNGNPVADSYEASVALGADFSVTSPDVKGYKLRDKDDAVIEGTMTAAGYTYDVVYVKKSSGGSSVQIESPNKPKQDNSLRFNTEDHFAFVNGYPDGTVKPTGDVTRAEVAAILYRVMDADCVKTYETTRCSFSDVVRGDWFNLYVATLENADVIVDTRTNGKFRPNEAITRAELAAMLAQFADIKSAANSFNDVSARHWASDEIAVCAKMGWINGYPDGSFRPDATITRAEMMAMINRALGRTPKSADDLLSGMKTWRDNANVNAWYYLDVQEATNSHTYTKSGTHETWKKLH